MRAKIIDEFRYERSSPYGRFEEFYLSVDQMFAKVVFAQIICALDDKTNNLVRRIDDTKSVGEFFVIYPIEILIDFLQKFLLLMMTSHLRSRRVYRGDANRTNP
jgi:hypothetical protein